jgi:hypothetical protein
MKVLSIIVLFHVALLSLGLSARAADNELTPQEKADGWILLFDGNTADGWMCEGKPMPDKQVKDGTLNTHKQGCYVSNTRESFGDFDFVCDFKFAPGCNSGVFIRISKPGDSGIGRGIEVQVLDSAARKKADKHDCGALYDLQEPSANAVKPPGQWNHMEVICAGPSIKVTLNDQKIIDADISKWDQAGRNPDGTKNKFNWAFKDQPRSGHLGLQDHGGNCWYKNIKVKRLETDKPASSN